MKDDNNTKADPKDGFDFIEYPCDYMFKAMCRVADGNNLQQEFSELVVTELNNEALLDLKSVSSRTGKFESISLTVRLNNRTELEAVYQAIVSSPLVVMTL